ncbi:hypothetical protein ACLVWU_12020 [Bdellovibrio sp. HCB290]|uniref:hypothetical protein n=1 Tax=Bdellovibrio sp. HCB290 TaxID=3394356 RepID=UPI0039B53410
MKYLIALLSLFTSSFAFAQPIDDDVKILAVTCYELRTENYLYANIGKAQVQGESGERFELDLWVDRFDEEADVLANKLCKNLKQAQKENTLVEVTYDLWLDADGSLHKYIVAE